MKHEWNVIQGKRVPVKNNWNRVIGYKSVLSTHRICIHCGKEQTFIGSHWEPPIGRCKALC